ncbi:cytochrome o ubiquinol oxidase subunit III [Candidatus Saccharibacteria bacterium]|nr:cytochrome o ubiquinol oxidase subunit III [Candidatus Saccharibacteria bacterium]
MSNTDREDEQMREEKTTFGFWVYLMTDCMLFAGLFATYAVLRNNTYGGPSGFELFNQKFVLTETLILLTSSFICGLVVISARKKDMDRLVRYLAITGLLGVIFLGMEIYEFRSLINEGNSWATSAFLSSFFVLVGTHGLHVFVGIVWMLLLQWQLLFKGFKPIVLTRVKLFGMFWHFLDVVWIFIFTFVYLLGGLKL